MLKIGYLWIVVQLSLKSSNLLLWLFRKQKLTVQLQLRNFSLKHVRTMYSGRTEGGGGGVMLLVHKDIPRMPLFEMEIEMALGKNSRK